MKDRQIVLLILFLFIAGMVQAQKSTDKTFVRKQNSFTKHESNLSTHKDFFQVQKSNLGLTDRDEMKMVKKNESGGLHHYKYKQFHNGVQVYGVTYILHEKDGKVVRANGDYLPLIDISTEPKIKGGEILQIAMEEMPAEKYSWQVEESSFLFKQKPDPKLVIIDGAFPNKSNGYRLAYQLELKSIDPHESMEFVIDAQNGRIIFKQSNCQHQGIQGTGLTRYYGEQSFTIDSISPGEFVLRDPDRGQGITTYNIVTGEIEEYVNNSSSWDLTNEDQDEVALDAHYCTQGFYDYMLEKFNWSGLDGEGLSMNPIVHARGGVDFRNAYWDGDYAYFGNGDCNSGPLTTFEVVGHEFMHGITDYTSDLIYRSESGAINEGMSDVFGKAFEITKSPIDYDWFIGGSFSEFEFVMPFRNMADPASFEHPDFYKGELWEDEAGVHTNSSVFNHWFYLMIEGESNVNENGEIYDVVPIELDKVMNIVWECQSNWLTESSTYPELHEYTKQIASFLYGESSQEYISLMEAWKAVGLPYITGPQEFFDIAIESIIGSQATCLDNEPLTYEFNVSNAGTLPIEAGTELDFRIELNFGSEVKNETVVVDNKILPGEMMTIVLPDLLTPDQGFNFIEVFLLNIDYDEENNDFVTFLDNYTSEADDLGILRTSFRYGPCFEDKVLGEILFENQSCTVLDSGANMQILATDFDGTVLFSQDYQTDSDLSSGRSRFIDFEFPADISSDIDYIVLDYSEDQNEENDIYLVEAFEIPEESLLDSQLEIDFNNQLYALFFQEDTRVPNSLMFYQDESYYFSTGTFQETFFDICGYPEDNFESTNNFSLSTLESCLDLQGMTSPKITFDLIQFRGENLDSPEEVRMFSTMAQIQYGEGDDTFMDVIYGQEPGELVHHEYLLPIDYVGPLSIKFFNQVGDAPSSIILEEVDWDINLMDNFRLVDAAVATEDIEPKKTLSIYPNPTSDYLTVSYSAQPDYLILTDVSGRRLAQMPVNGQKTKIDFAEFPAGYYIVTATYAEGAPVSKSVIHID